MELGASQQAVLAALDRGEQLRTVDAGRIVHAGRFGASHLEGSTRACCDFCVYDGRRTLRDLAEYGLVKRDREGVWTDATGGRLGGLLTRANGR